MLNMDSAATQLGLTMQLCMPLPSHILQSIKMRSVTQIRASIDYQRQITFKNQWAIGYTSILHHALGVFPFKDCFWSSNATQTDCLQTICQEPNALLETLSSSLSTGPVAPADKIGFLNKEYLMQTCRTDGLLLKPDVPARTLDLVFSTGFKESPRLYNLSHTYSIRTVHNNQGPYELRWHYILAANTELEFNIQPTDLGEPSDGLFVVFDYFVQPTSPLLFTTKYPLKIPALFPLGNTVNFLYYVIVPIMGGYTLIGERDKFVTASFERFGQIVKTTDTTHSMTNITIFGVPQEEVNLQMFHEPTQKVESYSCKIGYYAYAVLHCVEDNKQHKCTCNPFEPWNKS